MEWGDIILVAVSGLVGVVGTVVGTLVNYRLRQGERKSEWKREIYERDLGIVRDSVYAAIEGMTESLREPRRGLRHKLQAEADMMMVRAVLVETSLDDEELADRMMQLLDSRDTWCDLIDLDTGRPKEGKEEELKKVAVDAHEAASNIFRRIREILEEV